MAWDLLRWVVGTFGSMAAILVIIGVVRLFVFGGRARYEESLKDASLLKKGDIILTGKQSVTASWHIQVGNVLSRKLKHRFWTHAAIYQGDGKLWEAQPAPRGVIERNLQDYFQEGFYVRAFRHRYIQDPLVFDSLLDWCKSKAGEGYDIRGTIFYALSIVIPVGLNFIFDVGWIAGVCNVKGKYFCSELVVDAFDEAGYSVSPFDGWRVKPNDFIGNPALVEVK